MTRILKALMITSAVSACALLYVALQIELYRVSYSIHRKTHLLAQVQDDFERMRVKLFKLKAFGVLEQKIEAAHMILALPTEVKTVTVPNPERTVQPLPVDSGKNSFSILQFVKEAHAKIVSSDKEKE